MKKTASISGGKKLNNLKCIHCDQLHRVFFFSFFYDPKNTASALIV